MITNKASSNECQIVELSDPAAVMTAVHLTSGTVTNESLELTATNSSYEDQDSISANTWAHPSDLRRDKDVKHFSLSQPGHVVLQGCSVQEISDRLPVCRYTIRYRYITYGCAHAISPQQGNMIQKNAVQNPATVNMFSWFYCGLGC